MEKIVLFNKKEDCCGCGGCMNICPKKAISMQEDEYGFIYPIIDESLCIGCKLCKKVCSYQNERPEHSPLSAYAAVNNNEMQLLKSASGGVFSAIATQFLKENGVVFGATLTFENSEANPHHIYIESIEDLPKLQGSKYVQSSINNCYQEAKRFLQNGKKVLFSGTPCQIAGLYGYLGKEYDNLLTIEVICHGVPNLKIFNGYLRNLCKTLKASKIKNYIFRSKESGWGNNQKVIYEKHNKVISKLLPARLTLYGTLFYDGEIFRENCYKCRYAEKRRVADMTIGDYWGIEKEHPNLLSKGVIIEKNGVSCVLCNTSKGISVCENADNLFLYKSSYEKISNKNGQLKSPVEKGKNRDEILTIYKSGGYDALNKWFNKKYKSKLIIHRVYNLIPKSIRTQLKKRIGG